MHLLKLTTQSFFFSLQKSILEPKCGKRKMLVIRNMMGKVGASWVMNAIYFCAHKRRKNVFSLALLFYFPRKWMKMNVITFFFRLMLFVWWIGSLIYCPHCGSVCIFSLTLIFIYSYYYFGKWSAHILIFNLTGC